MTYHHQVLLAMELDRSHIGKLVQLITDSWSMTGTLTRVDQHDNREWEVAYPSRQLVPVRGEIYTTLHIGPWVGDVIGNQPLTVETVAGTLEAPETATRAVTHLITEEEAQEARAVILGGIQPGAVADAFDVPVELVDPGVIKGDVVEPEADPVHAYAPGDRRFTLCGQRLAPEPGGHWIIPDLKVTGDASAVTCQECKRRDGMWDDLPPEPPVEWRKRD